MNIAVLGDLGDFVGGLGVLLTLGYLVFQMRQNTRALRGAIHDTTTGRAHAFHELIASNEDVASIIARSAKGEPLTEVDDIRFRSLRIKATLGAESVFYQHERGNIETELLDVVIARNLNWFGYAEWFLNERTAPLTPKFERFMAARAQEALRGRSTGHTSDPDF
jgi:hypothetical protein